MSDENNEDVQTNDTPPQDPDSEWDTPPPPNDTDKIERDLNSLLREKLRDIIKKKD